MNAYEKFYLKHHPYCDKCSAPIPSTNVAKIGWRTFALCDAHARAYFPIEFGLKQRAELERRKI